jgi:hypothetical protein
MAAETALGVIIVVGLGKRRAGGAREEHQEKELTHRHYLGTLACTATRAPLQMSGA